MDGFWCKKKIWGRRLLPEVQRNLANIALSIAEYEAASMLVRQSDLATAKSLRGIYVFYRGGTGLELTLNESRYPRGRLSHDA